MANIVIKDLTENTELDRKAMRSITGGKATGPRMGAPTYQSNFFNNPLSFSQVRFAPGSQDHNSGNW